MPWSVYITYTCPICHKSFQSTHYKRPERCPDCRKAHRAKRSLYNYHKRRNEGRAYSKTRDTAYDGVHLGSPESVYSSMCAIKIVREQGVCQSCGNQRDLINGYCELCRGNCANEKQCKNPKWILARNDKHSNHTGAISRPRNRRV